MKKHEKVLGCILGAAVGDAMGAATETRTSEMILERFGGYVKALVKPPDDCFARGCPAGTVTDDFSLAYFTAIELACCSGKVDEEIAKRALLTWADYPLFFSFAGPTTQTAIMKLKGSSVPDPDAYLACNNHRATNGSGMKIFGVGLINPGDLTKTVYDTITICMPTHPNNVALSGASAIACAVSKAMEDGATLDDVLNAGVYGAKHGYLLGSEKGLRCAAPSIEKRILLAIEIGKRGLGWEKTMQELSDIIGSGLSAAESIPCVFGILAATPNDVMAAITMGVNIGNDTDTIATMAGAIAGALYGQGNIPANYLGIIDEVNHFNLNKLADDIIGAYYK